VVIKGPFPLPLRPGCTFPLLATSNLSADHVLKLRNGTALDEGDIALLKTYVRDGPTKPLSWAAD